MGFVDPEGHCLAEGEETDGVPKMGERPVYVDAIDGRRKRTGDEAADAIGQGCRADENRSPRPAIIPTANLCA
jgi:hypothetical protein